MVFKSNEQRKAAFANMGNGVNSGGDRIDLDEIGSVVLENVIKYKWNVQPELKGRYRSFEKREFPDAEYKDGRIAASMDCEDDYYPKDVKIGRHKPIKLRIADYSVTPWKWRKVIGEFKTVQDAKEAFERVLRQHPEIIPKDIK